MSKRYDIVIEQGATFELVVEWKDPAGSAINLAGYTAAMQVRKTFGGPTVLSLSNVSGIAIDAALGKLTITVARATTQTLPAPMQGVYDLEVATGTVTYRLLEGSVLVTPEVTR